MLSKDLRNVNESSKGNQRRLRRVALLFGGAGSGVRILVTTAGGLNKDFPAASKPKK